MFVAQKQNDDGQWTRYARASAKNPLDSLEFLFFELSRLRKHILTYLGDAEKRGAWDEVRALEAQYCTIPYRMVKECDAPHIYSLIQHIQKGF
jgi:hypothetical protein